MHPLVAVIGPTGSGKTALAAQLASHFHGILISCDAKQVYRGMDIGTNKDKTVPQALIDIKDPGEKMTVAEYQGLAYQEIDRAHAAGALPILVGGSMLYAEAVLNGYIFQEGQKSDRQEPRYRTLKLAPLVGREVLKQRIAARTREWLDAGLLDEIRGLLATGVSPAWLDRCGQEYRYFTRHLQGEISLEEAIAQTNTSLNQYVKRQYTWWRRHGDVQWVESGERAAALTERFLAR